MTDGSTIPPRGYDKYYHRDRQRAGSLPGIVDQRQRLPGMLSRILPICRSLFKLCHLAGCQCSDPISRSLPPLRAVGMVCAQPDEFRSLAHYHLQPAETCLQCSGVERDIP